jgi:hypothetical protein
MLGGDMKSEEAYRVESVDEVAVILRAETSETPVIISRTAGEAALLPLDKFKVGQRVIITVDINDSGQIWPPYRKVTP